MRTDVNIERNEAQVFVISGSRGDYATLCIHLPNGAIRVELTQEQHERLVSSAKAAGTVMEDTLAGKL